MEVYFLAEQGFLSILQPFLLVIAGGVVSSLGAFMLLRWQLKHAERSADIERKHALRMAGMDRRLEVLQQAYILWNRMMDNIHTDGAHDVAYECQKFWTENSIYLPSNVRKDFHWFYMKAADYRRTGSFAADSETFDRLRSVGEAIVEAAALPRIGEGERDRLVAEGVGDPPK